MEIAEGVKIEVGVVLTDTDDPKSAYRITRVGQDPTGNYHLYAWGYKRDRTSGEFIEVETGFGGLHLDGTPAGWGEGWYITRPKAETSQPEKKTEGKQDLMAFFSAVPKGFCPCGCLRELCPFHR